MAVVNFDDLEKAIIKVENVLSDYNEIEKELVLQQIAVRRQQQKQKQRVNDTIQNISVKDLFKKITKAEKG